MQGHKYWYKLSKSSHKIQITNFTCCFPPIKASSKSSLFLDSNLHQPFLEWEKAHDEVPIRFTRLVEGRKLSLCLSGRQCPPPSNQIHKSSPSFIEPLPLLFSCINRGCVVQLLTGLFKKERCKSYPMIIWAVGWPLRERLQIQGIHEGWGGDRGSTTLKSLTQPPDPVGDLGWTTSAK